MKLILVVLTLGFAGCSDSGDTAWESCQKKCSPFVSTLIETNCFCKAKDAWVNPTILKTTDEYELIKKAEVKK